MEDDSPSSPRQPRPRINPGTHHRENSLSAAPAADTERGRGRSRDASRASSRVRDGGSRTPRTTSTTGLSRPLTPIATSPLLAPISVSPVSPYRSLGVLQSGEGMRRTRSSDGYGSTGSTVPSPVPRAQRLHDHDVSPIPGQDDDSDGDPDITPRMADVSRIPGPTMAFPSRIDDRVRIQARRSLSSEEPRRRTDGHEGSRTREENVVMLDDV
jgi:hypothetical protein